MKMANILLRAAKRWDRRIVSKLVCLLADTFFDMSIFRRYIKSVSHWKDVTPTNTRVLMKEDVFHRVPVRGGCAKKTAAAHYTRSTWLTSFESRLKFAGNCIMYCVERVDVFSSAASQGMNTDYIRGCNEWMKKEQMRSWDTVNVWIDDSDWNVKCSVLFI